jgi:superfamily II DNA helicase RecQ
MITFKAGYIIDEIFKLCREQTKEEFEKSLDNFEKCCYYKVDGICEEDLMFNNPDQFLAVAFNIVNRGTPTRANLRICNSLLSQLGYIQSSDNLGNIFFINQENSIISKEIAKDINDYKRKCVCNYIYKPILMAQIQHFVLLLLLNKKITLNEFINIHCNELAKEIITVALEDLFDIIHNLYVLANEQIKKPIIQFTDKANSDISIGFEVFGDESIDYNYYHERLLKEDGQNIPLNIIITTDKIQYKAIGRHDGPDDQFVMDRKKEEALTYFLNNIFRKTKFRNGQLAIINRALQGKDVIGILPTGSGKSLAYQICTLLQPGISVIVDPIRSLMIDQYDKLRQMFIDKAIYINSFDLKEERLEKEQMIADGKIQYAILGPERFQMQEFRDYLKTITERFKFSYAIIDEAHCISEWGHDFRYSYLRLSQNIFNHCFHSDKSKFTQFALTATASFDVIADIQRELNMDEDVLVTIPPEEIDRKELQFIIEDIPSTLPQLKREDKEIEDIPYWCREKQIGTIKYPRIKEMIRQIPEKLKIERFFEKVDDKYQNCGILFCPTKSDRLGNGVVANLKGYNNRCCHYRSCVTEGLKELKILDCTTFMGDDNDGSDVSEIARESFNNQKNFLADKHNLMIATKAFGMGIDKPNIRYTIHYSIPQSVESFYQEAGRAGRDRERSLNYILYNKFDVKTNEDFIHNSHKSFQREKNIYRELLTEVNYETKFFTRIIAKYLNEQFYEEGEWFNLFSSQNDEFKDYLHLQKNKEKGKRIYYGYYHLKTHIIKPKQDDYKDVLIKLKDYIENELFPGRNNIKEILLQNKQPGLEEIIRQNGNNPYSLTIGFDNDAVERLSQYLLKNHPYPDHIKNRIIDHFRERTHFLNPNEAFIMKKIILDAYEFTDNENDEKDKKDKKDEKAEQKFIDNVIYEYSRLVYSRIRIEEDVELLLTKEEEKHFKKEYWRVRSTLDTLRAVYRLSIIGIIDDYLIDYYSKSINIQFSAKSPDDYRNNLSMYLRRYLGEASTQKWIEIADKRDEETDLRKYVFTLTDFFEETIAKKRLACASYIDELCKSYVENDNKKKAEEIFRESIIFYFTSKYAKQEFFPSDFYNSLVDNENISLFLKYIDFIENPPEDEQGLELNNAKHILGACDRFRQSSTDSNAIIDLLSSFSSITLNAKVYGHLDDFANREQTIIQRNLGISGFERLSEKEDLDLTKYMEAVKKYRELLVKLNPRTKKIADIVAYNANSFILNKKIKQFTSKFLENYGK